MADSYLPLRIWSEMNKFQHELLEITRDMQKLRREGVVAKTIGTTCFVCGKKLSSNSRKNYIRLVVGFCRNSIPFFGQNLNGNLRLFNFFNMGSVRLYFVCIFLHEGLN